MNLSESEIERRVAHHAPTLEATECHDEVRRAIRYAMQRFRVVLPDCREASSAVTKLEEAMFHANAAIARNHGRLGAEDRGLVIPAAAPQQGPVTRPPLGGQVETSGSLDPRK